MAPAFIIMALLTAGAVWIIRQLQSARCPSETFLDGAGQAGMVLQAVPIFLASIGCAFFAVNWLVHAMPLLREFSGQHGERAYRRLQRQVAKFSLVMAAIMLPIVAAASLTQYCLTPSAILYQPWPWSGLRHYSWQDVKEVETICTRGRRGGWEGSFFLVMRDGADFDLMAWPRSTVRAYPAIAHALNGVDFRFDATRVDPQCGVPFMGLLIQRP
jgi:hypothetical protein